MKTSLPPTFTESPLAGAPAASTPAALLDAFAGAFTPRVADGASAAPADFAQVLNASAPAAPAGPANPAAPAATAAFGVSDNAAAPVLHAPAVTTALRVAANTGSTPPPPESAGVEHPVMVHAGHDRIANASSAADAGPAAAKVVAATPVALPDAAPAIPERRTIEEALALMLPLLVQIPAAVEPPADMPQTAGRAEPPAVSAGPVMPPAAGAPREVRVTLTLPSGDTLHVALPLTSDPLPPAAVAAAFASAAKSASFPAEPPRSAVAVPAAMHAVPPTFAPPASGPVQAEVTLAGGARVAVALPLTSDPLPPAAVAAAFASAAKSASFPAEPPRSAVAVPAAMHAVPPTFAPPASGPVQAEVTLAGGARVAVALPGSLETRPTAPTSRAPAHGLAEKTAAFVPVAADEVPMGKGVPEKIFLTATKAAVTPAGTEAGIDVAQKPDVMPPLPSATIATVHAAQPVAALVEKLPATEHAPELTRAVQSLAHRAVEVVADVVEAQAVSRLQPVPSVQLRFKVGGEELSVRVEWRDGEVRTEFRTDSAELRGALAQEWRALAGRSDSAVRFLDPVIAASQPGQGSGSSAHGQSHGQSSPHQQHAQQQFRQPGELFGSVGRSYAAPPAPETPAVATPLVLPAHHRLSAVA